MRPLIASFGVGLLFAIGLGLSGMTQPQIVVSFLDIFGNWNPSLIFVMIGAILVHSLLYRLIVNRPSPLLAPEFQIPKRRDIDRNLIFGAIIFGVGWGIAGFCPAPALTALASFQAEPVVFVLSMVIGMSLFRFFAARKSAIG